MERICPTASEEMSFENVDGRQTDGRRIPVYTISSGELKIHRIPDTKSRVITKVHNLLGQPSYMRAWMSLKFGQIRLLVSMATDRVIMETRVGPMVLLTLT